jgi:hypothetical protein
VKTLRVTACAGVAVALACSGAQAQWSDNFDSYADGTILDGVGGWTGWDGAPGAAGVVTAKQSRSGPHSIEISGGADAVQPLSGYTSGQWTLTAWNYVPREGLTATTYFIVNNEYVHGGPYQWSIEMSFDPATGTVIDDFRGGSAPIVFDDWAELRFDIDLDADTIDTYYDGTLMSSGQYAIRGGPAAIANIDLFTTGALSYYDDMSLVPAPATAVLLALGAGAAMRRRR